MARVQPEDIASVEPGHEAQVVLTALNRRNTPPITSQVVSAPADRLEDERTGQPYFPARIELTESTGKRTALDYVLLPLAPAFDRALRED